MSPESVLFLVGAVLCGCLCFGLDPLGTVAHLLSMNKNTVQRIFQLLRSMQHNQLAFGRRIDDFARQFFTVVILAQAGQAKCRVFSIA